MKKLTFLFLGLMLCMLLLPQICLQACADAFGTWYRAVLPSLFPFMTMCTLIKQLGCLDGIRFGFMRALGLPPQTGMAAVLGMIAGYPNGARLSGDLQLTGRQLLTLLILCNLAGPMFLTSSVALVLLGDASLGGYMMGAQCIACILVALLFASAPQANAHHKPAAQAAHAGRPFGTILYGSVSDSLIALLGVGGLMALFACLFAVLERLGMIDAAAKLLSYVGLEKQLARALLCAGLEMTMGCQQISLLSLSLGAKAALCCAVTTFGGACIAMQTAGFSKINLLPYMGAKLLCGVLAGLLCYWSLSVAVNVLYTVAIGAAILAMLGLLLGGLRKRTVKNRPVFNLRKN